MSALNFPRASKQLATSKVTRTKTGVTMAAPWGSFLDFDATPDEAADLARFFGTLAAHFGAMVATPAAKVAEEEQPPAIEASESVEAAAAFPDVDPHVVALPRVKRAYHRKAKP